MLQVDLIRLSMRRRRGRTGDMTSISDGEADPVRWQIDIMEWITESTPINHLLL